MHLNHGNHTLGDFLAISLLIREEHATYKNKTVHKHTIIRNEDSLYEGQDVVAVCFTAAYFFAAGSFLQIVWKNGTVFEYRT